MDLERRIREIGLAKAGRALEAAVGGIYDDVRRDLAPHAESSRATGALRAAVDACEADSRPVVEGERVTLGIGRIDLLDSLTKRSPADAAGHWAFIEYGTRDQSEVSSWGPPPAETAPGAIGPAVRDASKKGIAPNRAWRTARFRADEHVKGAFREEFG